MKITVLIILFSLGTVFLFLKEDDQVDTIEKIETKKKKLKLKCLKNQNFQKKLNLGDLAKLLELLSLKRK